MLALNETLIIAQERDTVFLTLNRPQKGNAFNNAMLEALLDAFASLPSNTRTVVLQSTGSCFSTGMDLKWVAQNAGEETTLFAQALDCWYRLPFITLTVVNGDSYGGALGWIAASDMVICNQESKLQLSEIKLGLAPAMIIPYLLKAISPRLLAYLATTAFLFTGEQARRWGLVQKVVPQAEINSTLKALLATLEMQPKATQLAIKSLIRAEAAGDIDLMHSGFAETTKMFNAPEGREGISAFFEKRAPIWERCEE